MCLVKATVSNARICIPGQTDRFQTFSVGGWDSSINALPVPKIQVSFHLLFSFSQITKNPFPGEEIGMEVVGVLIPALVRRHDYHPWKRFSASVAGYSQWLLWTGRWK